MPGKEMARGLTAFKTRNGWRIQVNVSRQTYEVKGRRGELMSETLSRLEKRVQKQLAAQWQRLQDKQTHFRDLFKELREYAWKADRLAQTRRLKKQERLTKTNPPTTI